MMPNTHLDYSISTPNEELELIKYLTRNHFKLDIYTNIKSMFLECISDVENDVTITANKQPPLGNISTLLVEEIKEWEWDWG